MSAVGCGIVRGSGGNGFGRAPVVDAFLYGGSAIFALLVLSSSSMLRNTTWAEFAWPAYAAGALAALVLASVARRLGRRRLAKARLLLALGVLAGAAAVPLAFEVQWRTEPGHAPAGSLHPYAASEVVVTEGAAEALVRGRNPYSEQFTSGELAGRSPSTPEHFPYLPGMAVFGLPRALLPNTPWTDARIFFALATALVAATALARWRAPPERRLRALQVLLVLPTGALALVGGGHDMPVLALLLLALVLLERRRHTASAGAIAAAAMLKLTAWPLLFALAVTARGARRRVRSPIGLAVGFVGLGVLLAVAAGPGAFADDVLLFPAGLTSLPSPAASTTLGSMLLGAAGAPPVNTTRVALTSVLFVLAILGATAVLKGLAARPARAAAAASAAGVILLGLIMLSPVARTGYLVYPIDLLAWAFLLRPPQASPAALPLPRTGEAIAA
jgi:MFS family permease